MSCSKLEPEGIARQAHGNTGEHTTVSQNTLSNSLLCRRPAFPRRGVFEDPMSRTSASAATRQRRARSPSERLCGVGQQMHRRLGGGEIGFIHSMGSASRVASAIYCTMSELCQMAGGERFSRPLISVLLESRPTLTSVRECKCFPEGVASGKLVTTRSSGVNVCYHHSSAVPAVIKRTQTGQLSLCLQSTYLEVMNKVITKVATRCQTYDSRVLICSANSQEATAGISAPMAGPGCKKANACHGQLRA